MDTPENKTNFNDVDEFSVLEEFISNSLKLYKTTYNLEINFAKMATQVAHDIKSPIIVLGNFFQEASDKYKDLIIAQHALSRINEIADSLLSQFNTLKEMNVNSNQSHHIEDQFIYHELLSMIDEKKLQLKDSQVNIKLVGCSQVEHCLVGFNSEHFKRVVSNLINNSIESIKGYGEIIVSLSKNKNSMLLSIKDSGCGIQDTILCSFDKDCTSSKINGHGLGIPHAIKNIKDWGANYKITSKINHGTVFDIIFPLKESPLWMLNKFYVGSYFNIIIVSKNQSTYEMCINYINDKSKQNNFLFTKLSSSIELLDGLKNKDFNFQKTIFIVDFYSINSVELLIEAISYTPEKQFIILSDKYPDKSMQKLLLINNIKFFLEKNISEIKIINLYENPDLVLLDDQEMISQMWEIQSKKFNKKIITFNEIFVLLSIIDFFNKKTPIFLDSNLGAEKGEYFGKELFNKGFENIFITTGYEPIHFKNMPWIKGIIGKEPPFGKKIY